MDIEVKHLKCDVIVVGSGGTGSQAVQAAAEEGLDVLVISKDPMSSSDTKISEGVMTVRETGDSSDTEELLSENIKLAGGDISDENLTSVFASDSKNAYDRVRSNGLRPSINFEKEGPKTLPIAMGGHNKSRSVGHKNGGLAFGHANWDTIIKYKNVRYLEDCWFLDVVKCDIKTIHNKSEVRVEGGVVYDACRGQLLSIKSKSVILASGGLSTLYFPKTDTMRGNTGDSYAIGIRAGADLVDMEQIQFLPFCLASPPSYEGLLAGEPATASFLGVLRDKNNKVILDSIYLRTRAQCSEAIMRAVADGRGSPNGGAYLDMTSNKKAPKSGKYFLEYLKSALPSAYDNAKQALGKEAGKANIPWEIRPGAHYCMGGVRVSDTGQAYQSKENIRSPKKIEGLFAAGQAMGGLFGANRLGSTSLSELAVFGYRAGKAAVEYARKAKKIEDEKIFSKYLNHYKSLFGNKGNEKVYKLKLDFQKKCWDKIGPARTKINLKRMLNYLKLLEKKLFKVYVPKETVWNQQFIDLVELKNMIDAAKSVTLASLERNKSIGGHIRLDCKTSSFLSKPYSTLVMSNGQNELKVCRLSRKRTRLKNLIRYKVEEHILLLKAKILSLLPIAIKDTILEKKYKNILGSKVNSIELQPGSKKAAPGENLELL